MGSRNILEHVASSTSRSRQGRSFKRSCFCRDFLPIPAEFYRGELRRLQRPNARGWARALCPFHPDHNPSFVVNLRSGGFHCFACLSSGGNLIDFVMLRYTVDFRTAAIRLGAWKWTWNLESAVLNSWLMWFIVSRRVIQSFIENLSPVSVSFCLPKSVRSYLSRLSSHTCRVL
jgi:CHC2 zinc finger